MKRILFLVLVNIVGLSYLTAQTVKAQTESNIVEDKELGVKFIVPDGWTATKKEASYIMGSTDYNGFMLLKTAEFKSLKELKNAMQDGIEQEDGSLLIPDGDLNMMGKLGVSGLYVGKIDETDMLGFLMAILPDGKGTAMICISVAPESVFNQSNMDQLKILIRTAQRLE